MSSDRMRLSYDPTRQYHGLVKQAGRVTLEADDNEAYHIVNEAQRAETLDVVGPSGTPDDGYAISGGLSPFNFNIGAGTMYVGGMRVALPAPIPYGLQTEWLDHSGDPEWIDPSQPAGANLLREFVYLFLREQEVGAVEDRVLREVALGGPDTAERLRLIQRIVRLATNAATCAEALDDAQTHWAALGLTFNPQTMRLESRSRLQVGFQTVGGSPDPCEPQAHGGYLGADNQLIRVQVSAANRIVWGFDNASFLYRLNVIDSQTLELQSSPVDSFHFPRTGQAVEVLRSAAQLESGEYVASAAGVVQTLTAPYNPDTRRISLPTALPAVYLNEAETPVVFLKVWEQEKTFTPGAAVDLGTTGLQVTLSVTGGGPFHVGDYWQIAARPSTPTAVYPGRYLDAPQPPDGPRLWVCPLAVIGWPNRQFERVADCREPFDNLVELTRRRHQGCCTVTVGDGVTSRGEFDSIQQAVDEVSKKQAGGRVCILPGRYQLSAPVTIKGRSLIVSGCGWQTVIVGPDQSQPAFVIEESLGVAIESVSVSASSILGAVFVRGSRGVQITACRLLNGERQSDNPFTPAILVSMNDKQPSQAITIADNELRGFPAVSMQAHSGQVLRNRMTGGGVWVRSGSQAATLRGNEMVDGTGPGVWLGGLAPGEPSGGERFSVSRVEIIDNHITRMTGSGVSTLRSRQQENEAIIEDVTIVHNQIMHCALEELDPEIDPDSVGGIVLRGLLGARIHGNEIVENGLPGKSHVCGIFMDTCANVEITNNTIVANGVQEIAADVKGFQGGIIAFDIWGMARRVEGTQAVEPQIGAPAAVIHDNVVITPRGQALIVVAIGSVSVADNTLTSLGGVSQGDSSFQQGLCILVRSEGQPVGVPGRLAGYGLESKVYTHLAAAARFPDGRVLVHGNQITFQAEGEWPGSVDEMGVVMLASPDDVSFQDNQTQVTTVIRLRTDVSAFGRTVRASNNFFNELCGQVEFSYLASGQWNVATGNQAVNFMSLSGTNVINEHNQAALCRGDQEKPSDEVAVLVPGLVQGLNQARLATLQKYSQTQTSLAARLAEAERQLSADLGADHPQAALLRASAASAEKLKMVAAENLERVARRPVLKEHEWMVTGQVLSAEKQPASGLQVRLFDRDRKLDDLLGHTTTDEFGDFAVVYHERDFTESGEALPELYLRVEDAQGNVLYTSQSSLRIKAGRVEYFEIVLAPAAGGQKGAGGGQPPSPRPASPGEQPAVVTRRTARKK